MLKGYIDNYLKKRSVLDIDSTKYQDKNLSFPNENPLKTAK